MSRTDDLAGLLVPPEGEDTSVVQGIIRAFDPEESFENEVEVDGVLRRNVPVGSGLEALTYGPGDVVLIQQWFPGGRKGERGLATSWIDRRIITPGTGAAEKAVAALRTNLAKQIVDDLVAELLVSEAGQDLAAFVFGQRFRAASAAATVSTASASYVSLAGGPSVGDVEVSEGGTMIVMVGCNGAVSSSVGAPDQAAAMSFEVSGASSVSPVDGNAYILAHADLGEDSFVWSRSMAVARITGLNTGTHTVAARYRKMFGGSDVDFTDRTLIAIGL